MKSLILIISVLLVGCSPTHVPIKRNFPELPESLKAGCDDLTLIPENTEKLSVLLTTITENYGKYHVCRYKVDSWLLWYTEQKKNFESIK